MDKNLKNWIKDAKLKGFSDYQIKQSLLKQGYNERDFEPGKYKVLIFIISFTIILGLLTSYLIFVEKYSLNCIFADEPDFCYRDLAIQKNDFTICKRTTLGNEQFFCYSKFAYDKKDISICQKIEGYSRTECMALVTNNAALCETLSKTATIPAGQDINISPHDDCYTIFNHNYQNSSLCEYIENHNFKDKCYFDYAINNSDYGGCDKMNDYSIDPYKSTCYSFVALFNGDYSGCERIDTMEDYYCRGLTIESCNEVTKKSHERLKEPCITKIAMKKKDLAGCEIINSSWEDGDWAKENCIKYVNLAKIE